MANEYTHISDCIVPENWLPYMIDRTAELSELVTSGIVNSDAQFDILADGGGSTVNMPFWNDLTGEDEVLSDSASLSTGKITSSQDCAVILERGKAWKNNDLAGILAGSDPAKAMALLVAKYWARRRQATLLSILKGILAIASMADHILPLHVTTAVTPDETNFLNGRTFIDALQLMGDHKDTLTAVIMHSAVESSLAKQNLIEFVPDSEGKPTVKTFMGKRVIVDDGMPVSSVSGANKYTTYLFGAGAIALGTANGLNGKPVEGGFGTWGLEFFREALASNTGMINRQRFILHPRGVKWLGGVVAGQSPTNTELENASNWLRVWEDKHIPIVAVTHNIPV